MRLGIAAVVTANLTMLALMTATPLHVAGEHAGAHGVGDIGVIISLHVAGMFAPAPLTGRLGDRVGHRLVVRIGALLLALAGILAVGTVVGGVGRLAFALVLLGVGWNFAFIGGSSMITTALDARERPRVQGLADMAMGVAGMLGAAGSGLVVAWAGFAGLGMACALLGAALLVAASLLGTTRAATVRASRAQ